MNERLLVFYCQLLPDSTLVGNLSSTATLGFELVRLCPFQGLRDLQTLYGTLAFAFQRPNPFFQRPNDERRIFGLLKGWKLQTLGLLAAERTVEPPTQRPGYLQCFECVFMGA